MAAELALLCQYAANAAILFLSPAGLPCNYELAISLPSQCLPLHAPAPFPIPINLTPAIILVSAHNHCRMPADAAGLQCISMQAQQVNSCKIEVAELFKKGRAEGPARQLLLFII
jgi:hypothetical protein